MTLKCPDCGSRVTVTYGSSQSRCCQCGAIYGVDPLTGEIAEMKDHGFVKNMTMPTPNKDTTP